MRYSMPNCQLDSKALQYLRPYVWRKQLPKCQDFAESNLCKCSRVALLRGSGSWLRQMGGPNSRQDDQMSLYKIDQNFVLPSFCKKKYDITNFMKKYPKYLGNFCI
jgi:hypothetical protein